MALRKIGKILLYGCAGVLGAALLLLLAVRIALDRAPHYQAQIKTWVQARIGYHIAFTEVSPAFRWYGPELYFDRPELRSKDDTRVLARAAGGRIGIDLWQLLRSGKLFAGRIELDAPDVVIVRVAADKFELASEIEMGNGDSPLPTLRLDDLPAGTLAIKHGTISVKNWNAATATLELRDVNLQLRRAESAAAVALNARLPPLLGGTVSVSAELHGGGELATLSWTALARADGLDLAGWRQIVPEYLSRLEGGAGEFEVTARGQGASLTRADLDFGAQNVTTQLSDEPSVTFDQVAGVLGVTHAGNQWTLAGRRVRALRAGHRDPDSEFDVSWNGSDAGLLELHARASYLRAETLLPLAGLLPQKDLRERLQEAAPTGEWFDTHVNLVRTAMSDPWRLDVKARFRDMGFAPAGRAPGLRGLNGSLAGTDSGGRIDIDTAAGVFAWPAEFSEPVALEKFNTTLFWKRTPTELLVATPSVDLKTHDASMHGRLAWHQPSDGSSPVLVLASAVDNGNVADTRLYLPRLYIAPVALTWLNRAFPAGHLSHADVIIQGPVRHFPFRDGSGVFLARARIEALTLDYREGWPRAEGVAAVAEFRNEGMSVQLQGGHIGSLSIDSGNARFVDFKTAELQIHVGASGDAADVLGYLRATPLDAVAEHAFSTVEAKGPMQADVDLFFPFKEFDRRHTLVRTHLHGVSLNRRGSALAATELTGDADIEGAQVSRADVRGKLLGGAFQMQARAPRNRPVVRTFLVFNGTLSGDAVRSALSLPASVAIGGLTDWHGVLRMAPPPTRERSLRINSSLIGLELNLPEPLTKSAARPLPSSFDIEWPASGGAQVRAALGGVLRGQATLELGDQGPTLGRAAVAFGSGPSAEPAFSDSQLLNTGGAIDHLDLGGWLKLYTPDKNAKPLTNFFRAAKFEVSRIDYLGLAFVDVALDLAASDAGWRIGIGGPNVLGSISIPNAANAAEPWTLEFQRLKFIDASNADLPSVDTSSAPKAMREHTAGVANDANPRGIPAIDFHAADMIWDERQLGEVQATLVKVDDGIRLTKLNVTAADFSAQARGEWRGRDAGLGNIQGTLTSTDVGATLKDLGYAALIEAKSGKMDFGMKWIGAPSGEALSLATGHVQLALDKGQITGLSPGAGRVLGLTSLSELPRRLALDFSDLTDKGFAFDTVRGDFDLAEGSAYTDDVLVKGPAAEIGLIGRVGLKNRDYDQTAVVTGNVSSTLPLAAFVAGPVVGGAVLLFTQVFKQPLQGLARGYYRITGSWNSPTVERIKGADAASATAETPK